MFVHDPDYDPLDPLLWTRKKKKKKKKKMLDARIPSMHLYLTIMFSKVY
jgi:hypothetical protein